MPFINSNYQWHNDYARMALFITAHLKRAKYKFLKKGKKFKNYTK